MVFMDLELIQYCIPILIFALHLSPFNPNTSDIGETLSKLELLVTIMNTKKYGPEPTHSSLSSPLPSRRFEMLKLRRLFPVCHSSADLISLLYSYAGRSVVHLLSRHWVEELSGIWTLEETS